LEGIKGIGKNTADMLLKKFKSVKKIKALPIESLEEVIGKSKAGIIHDYFNSETHDENANNTSV
jgi:excinuclease ABC subunit C